MKAESSYTKIILISVLLVLLLYTLYVKSLPKPTLELVDVPFHIPRKKNDIKEIGGIPLTIYQSWRTNTVSVKMREAIYTLLDKNPEFDYYLYSDEKCVEFIKENFSSDVVDSFNTLKPGAYKSDLWRYCILYIKGGMYIDIKYYAVIPILDSLRRHSLRKDPAVYVQGVPVQCYTTSIFLREAYNGCMISPPANRVYKDCIDDIVNSCKLKLYKSSPLDITGPCLLLRMLRKYKTVEEIRSEPFTFFPSLIGIGVYADNIYYDGVKIFSSYPEYRLEQKSSKKKYYATMWARGEVYT
jgi:Glycosyltransferase sugar-binding region containing DXD motif